MSIRTCVVGSIKAYTEDRSRVLIYSNSTRKETWMNTSDISLIVPIGLNHGLWMDRQLAEKLGLVNGET